MIFDRALWERVADFHGHKCPGLAIGFRAAQIGMERLGVNRAHDEEMVVVSETDACGVDAIQVVSGCTLGKGNLILNNRGKQAFTFFDRKNNRALRVSCDPERLAVDFASREAKMEAILTAAQDDLCRTSQVHVRPPEQARIYASTRCTSCGERMGEPWARLRDGKVVCLTCRDGESEGQKA